LTLLATVGGIIGMGIVFQGTMAGSLQQVCQGAPLLLIGLWWAGRELGRSMSLSKARRTTARRETGR
jgi:hypothetical protein